MQMKKSTKYVILGIGFLTIIAGIYGFVNKGELYDYLPAFFIGVTLIGSVYFDQNKEAK